MSTEIELERIIYQKEFDGKFVGCQIMDGDIDVFLGIAGEDADLLCVASTFSEDMNSLMLMLMMQYASLLILLMVHMRLSSVMKR
ncbi:MAG: hypothetical protein ACLT33_12645 [Lachnospira pectinoschiza]